MVRSSTVVVKVMAWLSLAFVLLASAARADVISNFNVDDEGWTAFQNAGAPVQYFASGGNPGGYIGVTDYTDEWAYLQAPSKFLVPAQYNGSLSFDLQFLNDQPAQFPTIYSVRVGLQGAGLTLINEGALPATTWLNYSFALDELAGWRKFSSLSQNYSAANPIPTQAEMQAVLANLTRVAIATDYTDTFLNATPSGLEVTYIDNVRLTTVPEPSVLAFFALAGGAFLARRLRSLK